MKKTFLFIVLATATITFTGCKKQHQPENNNDANIANPASVYCEDKGGQLDMRENEQGVAGWCVFTDGSECEEWAFFRGECQPATISAIQSNDSLRCVIGRDASGQNITELKAKIDDCSKLNTEDELKNFCGKDTAMVSKCDQLVKLTSSLPLAGKMFFNANELLTCPDENSTPMDEMSEDCKNALTTVCQATIYCN